jgi:hypothetical protein
MIIVNRHPILVVRHVRRRWYVQPQGVWHVAVSKISHVANRDKPATFLEKNHSVIPDRTFPVDPVARRIKPVAQAQTRAT